MRTCTTIRTIIGALAFSLFLSINGGDRTVEAVENLDTDSSIRTFCGDWNSNDSQVWETFYKDITLAELLKCLEAGADPNERNNKGETPLFFAAGSNQIPAIIAALVDAGA